MTSSSSKAGAFRNVPPPTGAKSGNAYTRFIPREELQGFEAWKPGSLNAAGASPALGARQVVQPAPTEDQWISQVEQARRLGAQEGYQNGYRDGLVALESFKQSFAAQTTAQVGALLKSLDAEMDALQPRLAEAVARVAMDLARQVLRSELAQRPAVVSAVATQALQAVLLSARHITLQVHPQDVALVNEGAGELLAARGARVVPNATLSRGDCMVESDLGAIDARVATRWSQATAILSEGAPWDLDDGDAAEASA